MERTNNILIIGGMACGPKAGARARRCDPQAQITIIEQGRNVSEASCGLPYYISGQIESQGSLLIRKPASFKEELNIDLLTRTRALSIDCQGHSIEILNLETNLSSTLEYDKLVLATGSTPTTFGLDKTKLKGTFTLSTLDDAIALRDLLLSREMNRAVIVGACLIGLETAEAFVSQGLEVTIIEACDRVLPALLDFELAYHIGRHLEGNGVSLVLGQQVIGLEGNENGWVRKVITEKEQTEADLVLLALGNHPNTKLAQEAGLAIGSTGGIAVNQYLQTSDPDIYAGGDCVENVNRITHNKMLAPLGSTANKHGRVIGTNVTGGHETFPGVLGTAILKVFNYTAARVGLSEVQAREAGYSIVTCLVPGKDRATYYPESKDILVKLVVEKSNNRILGGQAIGPGEAAKRVDVLATALTFGATVDDLANFDLSYAPPYNSAMDPLHNAANIIRNKQSGLARALTPMEIKTKLLKRDDFVFLDVRSPREWEATRIEATQVRQLPLKELRSRLDELPANAEIVTLCKTSVRAYQAQRILDGAGFENIKFMDGSIDAWPYEISGRKPSPS